jgi:hypothetical protein
MTREFIPYEQALVLKELGFDEPCIYYVDKHNNDFIYNFENHPNDFIEWCGGNVVKTPLYQQAFRWFREKHKLQGSFGATSQTNSDIGFTIIKLLDNGYERLFADFKLNTHEEAELECLKQLIKIVKEKE